MMLGMVLMLGTVLTLGLTGCSESGDDDGSSGKGSVAIRLRTQYVHATRATGDWADPTNTIEKIHDYKVVFVDGAGRWPPSPLAMPTALKSIRSATCLPQAPTPSMASPTSTATPRLLRMATAR